MPDWAVAASVVAFLLIVVMNWTLSEDFKAGFGEDREPKT